jgi:hypothetical protein
LIARSEETQIDVFFEVPSKLFGEQPLAALVGAVAIGFVLGVL